jgi:hypothetical protein
MKKILTLFFCFSFGLINAQQTIEIPIIDGNDDAYQQWNHIGTNVGTMFMGTESLLMGFTPEPHMFYYLGLRYQSVPIPPGSTIESAFIQFSPFEPSEETIVIDIYCENNANPPAFTNEDYNITDRPWNGYNSNWEVPEWDWIPNDNSRTHNIKDLVQYVIDMEGWEKNNPIVFILKGNYPLNDEQFPKIAYSYEYAQEYYAPILTVTFTESAAVDEKELVKSLNISPNPVTDNFTVSLTDIKDGEYNISMYDLQGKRVYELHNGMLTQGDHQFALSASALNLEQGIYMLSIHSDFGNISRKIIVR